MYFLIGGGGKIGEMVARLLLSSGHEVAIVEKDEARSNYLAHTLTGRVLVVQGNCCDAAALRDAGAGDADVICALTGQDDTNLGVCEVTKTLFDAQRTIARVNDARNERIFTSLGVDVVSSTVVIARMVEQEALSTGLRTVMSLKHGEFAMTEVDIPNSPTLRAEGGRRAADLELPPSTILVAVSHGDQFDTVNGQTLLMPGDTVLVCARSDREADARRVLLEL